MFLTIIDVSFAIPNPAAVYCKELGYDYKIVKTEQGERGICIFPDKECEEWEFFKGICGKEYSYCAKHGYDIKTETDGKNPYSPEYAVCIYRGKKIGSVNNLMKLSETLKESELIIEEETTVSKEESVKEESASIAISEATTELPSTFDWRNKDGQNWMTSVKNQGSCGSCWAFADIGGVEAQYNIANNNPDIDLNLSEQDLVSCCSVCGSCSGGYLEYGLDYIQYTGVIDEDCFPYSATNELCSNRCSDWENRLTKICDWKQTPTNEPEDIKYYLTTVGPIISAMWYDMGGYFDENGIFRCNGNWGVNHGIVIVGYNDTGGYWILKNSWGIGWGGTSPEPEPYDGYFFVGYDTCSIANGGGYYNSYPIKFYAIIDEIAPSSVTDLTFINSTGITATLEWTATGNDGLVGSPYHYKIAFSTEPISESNYDSVQKQWFYNSEPAGTKINASVKGLFPETTYYFAVKAYDKCENPSDISNVISGTTGTPIILFEDDIESGNKGWNRSWTIRSNKTWGEDDPVLWHITEHRSTSPTHSWYYGIEEQWNYNTGTTNNGSLVSPIIDITDYTDVYLILKYSADLEPQGGGHWGDYFSGSLWIDDLNWGMGLISFNNKSTNGEFIKKMFYLDHWGKGLQITFDFESVDELYNDYEGIYLDDIQIIADGYKPIADANGPYINESGDTITFDGSASYDPDGDHLDYSWDFGDGSYGYEKIMTHTYSSPGVYNVSLFVVEWNAQSEYSNTTATVNVDSDGDEVWYNEDNCILIYNPDQRDINNDGYGNICDPDIDDDGTVDYDDYIILAGAYISTIGDTNYDERADFDNDDSIDYDDYIILAGAYGSAPGPSYGSNSDSDGWIDEMDNCWFVSNPDQIDTDDNCLEPPYTSDPECGDACTPESSSKSEDKIKKEKRPKAYFTLPYLLGITIPSFIFIVIALIEIFVLGLIIRKFHVTSKKRK